MTMALFHFSWKNKAIFPCVVFFKVELQGNTAEYESHLTGSLVHVPVTNENYNQPI